MARLDAHLHLYDVDAHHHDWVEGLGDLERSHLPEEYATHASASGVTGAVFVEVNCRPDEAVSEARWVADVARASPVALLGIVAGPRVDADDLAGQLDQLAEVPLVRGVRHLIEPDPGVAATEAFRRGVRAVGERGWTFDLCCRSTQLDVVVDLVRACPDVGFVLDHAAKPDIAGGEWEPWASGIGDLARADNVLAVKLSGLFSEGPPDAAPRYLAHALDAFGADRTMVGSDWPVCEESGTMADWYATVERLLSSAGAAEQEAVWEATARRVYRLDEVAR